jgi:hypothetical protein
MNDENRLNILEYNHKAGWLSKEKYEALRAEILKGMKK